MNENLRFGKQIFKVTRFQAKNLQKYVFIGALFYLRRKQAAALLNIRPAYRYFEGVVKVLPNKGISQNALDKSSHLENLTQFVP